MLYGNNGKEVKTRYNVDDEMPPKIFSHLFLAKLSSTQLPSYDVSFLLYARIFLAQAKTIFPFYFRI